MNLVTLKDWSRQDILAVVREGAALRRDSSRHRNALAGKTLALLFQKTSTRTRCSGEIGMVQLGGQSVYLDWTTTNFALAELGDEVRVLSSYCDFIVARLLLHKDMLTTAESSMVPVMNGCCDRYHPMQILADLQTIQETFGRLEGIRLTYTGVHNNVTNSLIAAAAKLGMEIIVVAPETNPAAMDEELFQEARNLGAFRTSGDLRAAAEVSDVIYTDTWIDMEYFADPAFAREKERRIEEFQQYQVNRELLRGLDTRVMHCLPAHRGYEIEGELLEDPRSLIYPQAENRLHSQKAVLLKVAGLLD